MEKILVIAKNDKFYQDLQRDLSGEYELMRGTDLTNAQHLVDEKDVAALLVDCPADAGPLCEFFRQNELSNPFMECVVLVDPENFCSVSLSKANNIHLLMRPVQHTDLVQRLRELKVKLSRHAATPLVTDPYFLRQQERRFWLTLLNDIVPEQQPLTPAPPVNFSFGPKQEVIPLLVSFRGWNSSVDSRQERRILRFGLQSFLEQVLTQQFGGVCLNLYADCALFIIYEKILPTQETLVLRCRQIIDSAARGLKCNVSCYCGEPCRINQVTEQIQTLRRGDWNNVLENQRVFLFSELKERIDPLSVPVTKNWMMYFVEGQLEMFCSTIHEYFEQAIAAKILDREFLICFQQDMLQDIGFALKNAGISASTLFGGSTGEHRKKTAIRSVPNMEEWVREIAREAMQLAGISGGTKDVVRTVHRYVHLNLNKRISRADIAALLHLSEGHVARVFREETGMSLTDYVLSERIHIAKELLEMSDLSPSEIAQRSGFSDYPNFYKKFKREVGVSPSEYRLQMCK